ncbi:MAG: hypothetical protein ACP6IQ_02100 [Candidatus Njordarchaeia archaeon]
MYVEVLCPVCSIKNIITSAIVISNKIYNRTYIHRKTCSNCGRTFLCHIINPDEGIYGVINIKEMVLNEQYFIKYLRNTPQVLFYLYTPFNRYRDAIITTVLSYYKKTKIPFGIIDCECFMPYPELLKYSYFYIKLPKKFYEYCAYSLVSPIFIEEFIDTNYDMLVFDPDKTNRFAAFPTYKRFKAIDFSTMSLSDQWNYSLIENDSLIIDKKELIIATS